MKRIVALLILCFAVVVANAQTSPYIAKLYKTDSIGADAIVKDIVASTGKAFKFNSRQSKNNTVVYFYEPIDKNGKDLMISLSTWNDGENKDLKIEGTKVYKLKSVYGTFLDLYPFWKANVSDKLTPEVLTTNLVGDTYLINPPSTMKKLRFKKYQDTIWSIDCI